MTAIDTATYSSTHSEDLKLAIAQLSRLIATPSFSREEEGTAAIWHEWLSGERHTRDWSGLSTM